MRRDHSTPRLTVPPPPSQADLLISTLGLPSRAHALSPDVLPCVGVDAVGDGPAAVATELQLYGRDGDDFAVLQQRAPAAVGRCGRVQLGRCIGRTSPSALATLPTAFPPPPALRQAAFATALVDLARRHGVARLVVLASVDARARGDAQLLGGDGPQGLGHRATDPDLAKLAEAAGAPALADAPGDPPLDAGRLPPWPVLRAAAAGGPPALVLAAYASEGDNATDAKRLVGAAATVLGVVGVAAWTPPGAWAAAYGGGARADV